MLSCLFLLFLTIYCFDRLLIVKKMSFNWLVFIYLHASDVCLAELFWYPKVMSSIASNRFIWTQFSSSPARAPNIRYSEQCLVDLNSKFCVLCTSVNSSRYLLIRALPVRNKKENKKCYNLASAVVRYGTVRRRLGPVTENTSITKKDILFWYRLLFLFQVCDSQLDFLRYLL